MSMWSNNYHSGVLDLAQNAPKYLTKHIKGSFVEDKSPETPCTLEWGIIPTAVPKKLNKEVKEEKQIITLNMMRMKGKNNFR